MFVDDSEVFSFSRRLGWSPDGSFFIIPAGYYQKNKETECDFVSYGYVRHDTSEPAFILPSVKSCPLVVRFCPVLMKREIVNGAFVDEPFIDLPYIVAFAIASQEQVMIYTTRSLYPFAVIGNIHYAELTDLTWKNNETLMVSSRDGFITHITFKPDELGEKLYYHEIPEIVKPLFEGMHKY